MGSDCKSPSSGRQGKDKDKDDYPSDSLRDPCAIDASMAFNDNEDDQSISAVDTERGEGGADVSRPASPTPPLPASQPLSPRRASQTDGTLADHLAGMVARGEDLQGLEDEDALIQGDEEKRGNLDSEGGKGRQRHGRGRKRT